MPPRKRPKTLQELSLNKVARLTHVLCVNIVRKYGGWKASRASLDDLEIGKTYLSSIYPLFDDLWKVIFGWRRNYVRPTIHINESEDVNYMLMDVLLCDKLRILDNSGVGSGTRDGAFWQARLLNLKSIVELEIEGAELTDEAFQAIGDVCTDVRKLYINFDIHRASTESLKHILKCRELKDLKINFIKRDYNSFREIKDEEISECVRMLVAGLPKLEYFHDWLRWDRKGVISMTKPFPSMRKLDHKNMRSSELAAVIRLCPNLTDLTLQIGSYEIPYNWASVTWDEPIEYVGNSSSDEDNDWPPRNHYLPSDPRQYWPSDEGDKVLRVLAESSLQLKTLILTTFDFHQELTRVIASRCANLTRLFLNGTVGRRISVNDVYTIGVSCPGIVKLKISNNSCNNQQRYFNVQLKCPNMEEQTFITTPRMFVALKVLNLLSNIEWDQRILPLILRHANNLTKMSLINVFKPTNNSVDPLSEILNANALQQLESLHICAKTYNNESYMARLPIASLDRILDGCHKLNRLSFVYQLEDETKEYLKERQSYMKSENFDFYLNF